MVGWIDVWIEGMGNGCMNGKMHVTMNGWMVGIDVCRSRWY
jgi:hypothetical protein